MTRENTTGTFREEVSNALKWAAVPLLVAAGVLGYPVLESVRDGSRSTPGASVPVDPKPAQEGEVPAVPADPEGAGGPVVVEPSAPDGLGSDLQPCEPYPYNPERLAGELIAGWTCGPASWGRIYPVGMTLLNGEVVTYIDDVPVDAQPLAALGTGAQVTHTLPNDQYNRKIVITLSNPPTAGITPPA